MCAAVRQPRIHAVSRPAQEPGVDEKLQQFQARSFVESQEPLGLSTRQPQPRHLDELAVHA
jgi:hypothetical protein